MKKIIGLCLVMLMVCSVSMFAQWDRSGRSDMDPSKRVEKMITDLNLSENQATDLRKIENEYHDRMKNNMESMQRGRELTEEQREAMRTEREKHREQMETWMNEKNERVRGVLTEDQYRRYIEMQRTPQNGERPNNRRK